jgi:hypothetical protein
VWNVDTYSLRKALGAARHAQKRRNRQLTQPRATPTLTLNPFPTPGIQSVRPSGPSGRRERPRGRPDPPDGSPGPWEHKEGGHQRTRLPTRPSRLSGLDGGCPASRHAQPVNHGTSLSDPAATLATVSFHKVEHLCQVPLDGSDALLAQTCSAFLNMSAGAPPDESWTAGPESRARTCSLRRNGCL